VCVCVCVCVCVTKNNGGNKIDIDRQSDSPTSMLHLWLTWSILGPEWGRKRRRMSACHNSQQSWACRPVSDGMRKTRE
jgi:hypothetical protein